MCYVCSCLSMLMIISRVQRLLMSIFHEEVCYYSVITSRSLLGEERPTRLLPTLQVRILHLRSDVELCVACQLQVMGISRKNIA
jgi:hypothetical protein